MKYQNKSFSVPTASREECQSHWKDRRGFCVFCGAKMPSKMTRELDAQILGITWEGV